MKAIVHIGAPKTGSSTIQAFLGRNVKGLAAQGFRYHRNVRGRGSQFEYPLAALASVGKLLPGVEEQTRYSSTDLATHVSTGRAIVAQLAANRARWREPVALFSSEHIYPWLTQPEPIAALDRIFRDQFDEVRYILYIRNQEDLIVSEYSEVLKRGSNLRLQGLLNRRMRSLDWEHRIRSWVEVLGRDRFDLRLMDRDFLVGGDLLADFAAACGFSLDGLTVPHRVNESLSAPAAECLRMMNERVPQMLHDGRPNPLRKGMVKYLMAMSPPAAPALCLTAEQRRQVGDHVAEGNERLRAAFFPDRQSLFAPASARKEAPREKVLEHALDLASRLIIRLRLGDIPILTGDERDEAVVRKPGGLSNGIAANPRAAKR